MKRPVSILALVAMFVVAPVITASPFGDWLHKTFHRPHHKPAPTMTQPTKPAPTNSAPKRGIFSPKPKASVPAPVCPSCSVPKPKS